MVGRRSLAKFGMDKFGKLGRDSFLMGLDKASVTPATNFAIVLLSPV
jgi:hypothetical protein